MLYTHSAVTLLNSSEHYRSFILSHQATIARWKVLGASNSDWKKQGRKIIFDDKWSSG